jgi:MFS family permease
MEKIPILLMFLGHIWVDTSQGILPVVLPKLKETLDLNYFQVGFVVTVLNLTSSVIQPIFGYISDKIRTGWFVPVGILWTACMMGLLGWAPGYRTVLLLVGFAGLGTAAFHPRAMMVVNLMSGSRKGLGAAIFSTGGNLGFALGPMVGSLLVLGFGLHATIGLLGPGVLMALTIFLCPGDFLRREAPEKWKAKSAEDGSHSVLWRSLILTCLVVTLRSWAYLSSITYLPLFMQEQGHPLTTGSLVLSCRGRCSRSLRGASLRSGGAAPGHHRELAPLPHFHVAYDSEQRAGPLVSGCSLGCCPAGLLLGDHRSGARDSSQEPRSCFRPYSGARIRHGGAWGGCVGMDRGYDRAL